MTEIAKNLIAIGRRIGRWVLERLIKRGAIRLGHYMIERAETVFTARLKRAKTARRKRWLRGRITRWKRAGTWLLAWASDVAKCMVNEADTLLAKAKGLPLIARCERLVAA